MASQAACVPLVLRALLCWWLDLPQGGRAGSAAPGSGESWPLRLQPEQAVAVRRAGGGSLAGKEGSEQSCCAF